MGERKKRCLGCRKILSIDKFPTYKTKHSSIVKTECYCRKCRYARDSKATFKKTKVVDLFIERSMYGLNGRDY